MRNKQALTTGDVAKHCGVSFRTVIRWIESGRLPAYRLPGRGDNRIHIDDFLQFLSDHDMPLPEALQARQRRVLIVAADPQTAEQRAEVLRHVGLEARCATDAFSAGALMETFAPAVIIVDLDAERNSPKYNAVSAQILDYAGRHDAAPPVKVLVITDEARDVASHCDRADADAVLQAPLEDSKLVSRVTELVKAHRSLAGQSGA